MFLAPQRRMYGGGVRVGGDYRVWSSQRGIVGEKGIGGTALTTAAVVGVGGTGAAAVPAVAGSVGVGDVCDSLTAASHQVARMPGARSNTGVHTTLGAASTHVSVTTQIADPRCTSAKEGIS